MRAVGIPVFDSLLPLLISGFALGFCAAAFVAFAHRVQGDVDRRLGAGETQPKAISAVWTLLVAALFGLVYGNSWPQLVVVTIGGALLGSGWIRKQAYLRWTLTLIFFSSVTISAPSPEGVIAKRFSVESFGDPPLLLALVLTVMALAILFRRMPRHAVREIGAPTPGHLRSDGPVWLNMTLFSTLLLIVAYAASVWHWPHQIDAAFLAAAPLGVIFGGGIAFILQAAAQIEAAFRALEPRRQSDLQPLAIGGLGLVFLLLLGTEFRLLGPALFIGYIVAAGILIASSPLVLLPPRLETWLPQATPRGRAVP